MRSYLAGLLVIVFSAASLSSQSSPIRAIRAGSPVDGTGAPPGREVPVVVERGRIAAVAPGFVTSAGAEVIDLSGGTLMPGLMDTNAHLGVGAGHCDRETTLHRAPGSIALVGAYHALRTLLSPFTAALVQLVALHHGWSHSAFPRSHHLVPVLGRVPSGAGMADRRAPGCRECGHRAQPADPDRRPSRWQHERPL